MSKIVGASDVVNTRLFMLAPAVGKLMADLVASNTVDPLIDEFSLRRFASRTASEGLQI